MTDWAVHPGEILREALVERGISVSAAADRMGVSQPYLSAIVNGRSGIGPVTALKLERLTGIRAEMWASLAAQYAVHIERKRGI